MWLIEISSGKEKFMPDNSYNNLPAKVKAKYQPRDKADIEAVSLEVPAVTKFEFSNANPAQEEKHCEHKAIIEDLQKQLEESIIKYTDSQAELTTEKELNDKLTLDLKDQINKVSELEDKKKGFIERISELESQVKILSKKPAGRKPKQ